MRMLEPARIVRTRFCVSLVAALLISNTAQGQDNGIFVGVSAGDVSPDYDWPFPVGDAAVSDESGYKLVGGIRPFDSFAVEVNYADLGRAEAGVAVACPAIVGFPCPSRQFLDARALSVSAVGYYSLPFFDLFGRIGAARWETERGTSLGAPLTDEGTDPTYGIGAQIRLGSFAIRAEYEEFDFSGDSAELASIGFTYTFF